MMYSVRFMVEMDAHTSGSYEDYAQARARCLELVKVEADSAWIEETDHPEMKSRIFLKEPPPIIRKKLK